MGSLSRVKKHQVTACFRKFASAKDNVDQRSILFLATKFLYTDWCEPWSTNEHTITASLLLQVGAEHVDEFIVAVVFALIGGEKRRFQRFAKRRAVTSMRQYVPFRTTRRALALLT